MSYEVTQQRHLRVALLFLGFVVALTPKVDKGAYDACWRAWPPEP